MELRPAKQRRASTTFLAGALVAVGITGAMSAVAPLFAVAVAGLIFLVGVLPVPWVFSALLASTFASGIILPVSGFSIRLEHIVLVLAIALLVRHRAGLRLSSTPRQVLLAFATFIAWNVAVSLVHSPDFGQSLRMAAWLSADAAIFAVFASAQARDMATRLLMVGSTIAGFFGVAAIVLYAAAARGYSGWGVQYDYATGAHVPKALAYEANLLGSTLALWAVVTVGLLHRRDASPARRRFLWLMLALTLAGVVLTLSRGAVAGLAAGLLGWAVLTRADRWRRVAGLALVGVITALVLYSPPVLESSLGEQVATKAGRFVNFHEGTGYVRFAAWKDAVSDLDANGYVFGLGLNSFGFRHDWVTGVGPGYISNLFVQLVYDGGIVALALFLWVLLIMWFSKSGSGPQESTHKALIMTFCAASLATSALWLGSTWAVLGLFMTRASDSRVAASTPPALRTWG